MFYSLKKKIVISLIFILLTTLFLGCTDEKEENHPTDDAKPVIYLYPEKEKSISVNLQYDGELICTYPEYKSGWEVIAKPDGTLVNLDDNMEYSYLFWEGKSNKESWGDISEGFVVKGINTKDFLQKKLSEIGLTPKEYNEFIVYWLPQMKDNEYNLIYFAQEKYRELAKLQINPKPDSILRVFMVFKPLNKHIEVKEQKFSEFTREGFTVIEWGGTEIK